MIKQPVLYFTLPILFLTFGWAVSYGQDSTQTSDGSLAGQYREIIQKSKINAQGFKIINPSRLGSFSRNVSDSLNQSKKQLSESEKTIASQNKAIQTLQSEISTVKKTLADSRSMVAEISLLGFAIPKSTYNLLMWGLVSVLSAILSFTIFRAAADRREATYRSKLFNDLAEEFQSHKIKANDKEKKLARELQTEKNRVEELSSR